MRPLLIIGCSGVLFFLQQMIFVGNIECRQHRQPHSIDGVGRLGHRPHFGVHVFRELQNIFRIRPAQVVGLIENLHPHAGVLRVPYWLILGRRCHFGLRRELPLTSSWPQQSIRSAPASSRRGRGYLRVLSSTAPFPGATAPVLLHDLPVAAASAAHRVRRWLGLPALTCTSLWCGKSSVQALENRPPEPCPPPARPLLMP